MPPLPNVSKVIRVDLFQTLGQNTRGRDRIFFSYSGAGPTVADLTTLATTVRNAWNTNIVPLQLPGYGLNQITITDLNSATGAQVVSSQSTNGTRAGNGIPNGSAVVVRFKIARRYRGGHPRLYLSAGASQDLASSFAWTGAFTTAVASGFLAFISACEVTPPTNLGILAHVNVSYFTGFTAKQFPSGRFRNIPNVRLTPLQDGVLSYSTNPQVASQRRRNLQSA